MPYTPVIDLKVKDEGCLLNCIGMQPLFFNIDNYGVRHIPFVDIFCVDRLQNKQYPDGKVRIHSRTTTNNTDIFPKTFAYDQADQRVVNVLLKNSDHFKLQVDSSTNIKQKVLYQCEFIKYRTTLSKANFFISSNEDLLAGLNFKFTELSNYDRYLVDENTLPNNMMIIGSRVTNTFANPICACPLIEKQDWIRFGQNHLPKFLDMTKNLPIVEHKLDEYEVLQAYLDSHVIDRWYIHEFSTARIKAPYITIYL